MDKPSWTSTRLGPELENLSSAWLVPSRTSQAKLAQLSLPSLTGTPSTDNSNSSPESSNSSTSNSPSGTNSSSFTTPSANSMPSSISAPSNSLDFTDSTLTFTPSETPPGTTSQSPKNKKKERLMKDRANGLLIHDRLFHPSKERLCELGVKFNPKDCDYCILGNHSRTPFLITVSDKTEVPLLRVSSDICGQINPISFSNAKYVLTFYDLSTDYSWIYTITDKKSNTVLEIFKHWLAMVERQSGYKLKFFHTDSGKEYTGKTVKNMFTAYLEENGIVHESTRAYSSASNGAAECL